jgi:hypothetical protein
VPDAITVALEDGPLNQDAPAADLANRLERLTYPEPFAGDPDGPVVDAPHDDLQPSSWPTHDREPMTW